MSAKAKAMRLLYRRKKITIEALQQSVADGVITAAEYEAITGKEYSSDE